MRILTFIFRRDILQLKLIFDIKALEKPYIHLSYLLLPYILSQSVIYLRQLVYSDHGCLVI